MHDAALQFVQSMKTEASMPVLKWAPMKPCLVVIRKLVWMYCHCWMLYWRLYTGEDLERVVRIPQRNLVVVHLLQTGLASPTTGSPGTWSVPSILPRSKFSLRVMNPRPPSLYGLPKIHKANVPIRPIVSYISSPTYHLCKYLNHWFKVVTNFRPQYTVLNSIDLIEKLKTHDVPENDILISLDVTSLYTHVPLNSTINSIENIPKACNIHPDVAKEFILLLGKRVSSITFVSFVIKSTSSLTVFLWGLPSPYLLLIFSWIS